MNLTDYLAPRGANHVPLTPLDSLRRSVQLHAEKPAVIHGERRLSYAELGDLIGRMASALRKQGVGAGDVVSVMAANRPEMLALHFAVPMIGAVLNTINTRLDVDAVAYIFAHASPRAILCDQAFADTAKAASERAGRKAPLILCDHGAKAEGGLLSLSDLVAGETAEEISLNEVKDEWQAICLNYTSGTTGRPKGVVYHHRGAYLNSLGNVLSLGFDEQSTYLWILPMFHCNGWQHPFAVTAAGGTHVCLAEVDPGEIFSEIERCQVTHMCCAPVVLYMLLNHPDRAKRDATRRVRVGTGGASPTTALIEGMDALGFDLVHLYGLTESYGPATICAPSDDQAFADAGEKARYLSRQGVRHPLVSEIEIVDEGGAPVAPDGETLGEIVLRSNTLMAGYYRNPEATEEAFSNGYFRTGDLAVRHPDGCLEIKDRAKDIIISGGENISSLEVENVLHQHPAVLIAAVVGVPHPKWGETPCACIELKPGVEAPPEEEIIAFAREHLAHFKAPRRVVFCDLPKTATGKIQKFELRQRVAKGED